MVVWHWSPAVSFDMILSNLHYVIVKSPQKPSSSYSLLKFVYVTSQLRHSLAVHLLRHM